MDGCLGILANEFLPYLGDVGSGKCRMSSRDLVALKIGIGWIIHLHVVGLDCQRIVNAFCTVWPDSRNQLFDGTLCIDVTSTTGLEPLSPLHGDISIKIVAVRPPVACRKVAVAVSSTSSQKLDASSLSGLVVAQNCRLVTSLISPASEISLIVRSVSPSPMSVITPITLVVVIDDKDCTVNIEALHRQDSPSPNDSVVSETDLVREVIRSLVVPSLLLPVHNTMKGMLLYGPPGTGKTYAVKACQSVCRPWCEIAIFELNIPMLLSESNPLALLNKIFLEASDSRAATDVYDKSIDGPVDVTATTSPSPSPPQTQTTKPPRFSFSSALKSPDANSTSRTSSRQKIDTSVYNPRRLSSSSSLSLSMSPLPTSNSDKSGMNLSDRFQLSDNEGATEASLIQRSFNEIKTTTDDNLLPVCDSLATGTTENIHLKLLSRLSSNHNVHKSPSRPKLNAIIIDELDALGVSENQSDVQAAIKAHICSWLDKIQGPIHKSITANRSTTKYCLIATSNRPEDIDTCFRRGGRLDKEVHVISVKKDRARLLRNLLTASMKSHDVDIDMLLSTADIENLSDRFAESSGGYVAADLVAVIDAAWKLELKASRDETAPRNSVSNMPRWTDNLVKAFEIVSPSCLRGITLTLPKISYDDVIGCKDAKKSLQRILSLSDPNKSYLRKHFQIQSSGGALLHGPPGNSKTRLVMAAAASHNLPVITLSSADVYSPYVGDAEAEVRKAFRVARQGSPCILFLDEIDALVTNRGSAQSGGSTSSQNVESRVLSTLLNEMDGIGSNAGGDVIVLAATNRIDCIDSALLRKGRFHHILYVPSPNSTERIEILNYFGSKCHLTSEEMDCLRCQLVDGMSGADIENLCREVKMSHLRSQLAEGPYRC